MRFVLDTNVLVSALLNPRGAPAGVLNTVLSGKRARFGFPDEIVAPLLEFIGEAGEFVTAEPIAKPFRDSDDKPSFEVALSGNASYIVTGNLSHFPKHRMVITPRGFLEKLR